MSTSGNFTVLVANILDSCSLLKRDLTADSGGYSSKHYYYSPGHLDAFALRICSSLLLVKHEKIQLKTYNYLLINY
ncbi:hypothetical protein QUA54_24610 [Microcoleus sp. MOSTC5]|uniref:hypothetical protein n=1 Tax=Microcoleus sp. MOSTC5 TaxID=3055378 RepID=UPI002FD1B014